MINTCAFSWFDEGAQYKCTLLVMYEDGNQSEPFVMHKASSSIVYNSSTCAFM